MGRKKEIVRETLLSRRLHVKLTVADYNRLEQMQRNSDCQSISEFVRRTLLRKPIAMLTRDTSLDEAMEELIRLRKELHFIGHNINQITHHFHSKEFPKDKLFFALKAIDEFDKVQKPLNAVMEEIAKLGKQWLQK